MAREAFAMRRSSAERASVVLGVDEGEDEVLHCGHGHHHAVASDSCRVARGLS